MWMMMQVCRNRMCRQQGREPPSKAEHTLRQVSSPYLL